MKAFVDGFNSVYQNKTWQIMIFICTMVIIVNAGYSIYDVFAVKRITIDSNHFSCTGTEPNGIIADCTQYTKLKGA